MADDYVIQMVTDSMKELVQLEDGQLAWRVTHRTYMKGDERLSTPQTVVSYVPVDDGLLPSWVLEAAVRAAGGIPLVYGAESARSQPQVAPRADLAAMRARFDALIADRATGRGARAAHRRQQDAELARLIELRRIERRLAALEGPLAPRWGEQREMGLEILTEVSSVLAERQQLAMDRWLLDLPGVDWGSLLPRPGAAETVPRGGVDKSSEIEER